MLINLNKQRYTLTIFFQLGIQAVGDSVKAESGKDFMLDAKYGYIHACPTNLGTGMRASVHVDLPGYTKHSVDKLKERCEELHLQPRGIMNIQKSSYNRVENRKKLPHQRQNFEKGWAIA